MNMISSYGLYMFCCHVLIQNNTITEHERNKGYSKIYTSGNGRDRTHGDWRDDQNSKKE